MVKPLERSIEGPCVRRALANGWLHRKMNGMGHNSWPDQLFIAPDGEHVYVEFKRPGHKPTPKQEAMHRKLEGHHCTVLVIDNKDDFYWWVLRRGGRRAE